MEPSGSGWRLTRLFAMADFNTAYNIVAGHEGGYQNNPADRGNYNSKGHLVGTNWGISAPVYESWIGRPPSYTDIRTMTRATAKEIFRKNFWDEILGDQIQSQAVANIFLDGVINHGRTGIKLMQKVLGVAQDGIVGPITLQALNTANPAELYGAYRQARRSFYHYLVERTPSFSVFLKGWLRRIDSFQELISQQPAAATGGAGIGIIALALLAWRMLR